jgi:hypothetical protein
VSENSGGTRLRPIVGKCSGTALTLLLLLATAVIGLPAAAQPIPDSSPDRLRLDIAELSPRVLTANSQTLSVSGTITNIGDRRLSDLSVRLQLGQPQTSEQELAAALTETPPTDVSQSRFVDVTAALQPGQSAPLRITVPLDGSPAGLAVSRPGVYPLLINVNGTPDYGGPARLAALSTLLPVLDVPGQPTGGDGEGGEPVPLSLLWPIADLRPRVVAAPYGGQVVLADDSLADALRPGGRLHALVTAAGQAQANEAVAGSLCFAIDPALLETVEAMSSGYAVRTADGDVPGRGDAAAGRWLDALRQVTAGHCVVTMPYAGADLAALSRVRGEDPALVREALGGAATVERVLGVQPLDGVLWPDGQLNNEVLDTAADAGVETLITDPAMVGSATPLTTAARIEGSSLRAQPVDPLVSDALLGGGRAGSTLTPADEPDIATQDGLAALAFRGGLGVDDGPGGTSGDPVLLAPPQAWNVPAAELTTFLRSVGDLTSAGLLAPVPLQQQLAAPATGDVPVAGADSVTAGVAAELIRALAQIDSTAADVRSAMSVDPTQQVEPAQVMRPIRTAIIRATSTVFAGDHLARQDAVNNARGQLDTLRSQVSIAEPPQTISLASGDAPLPVLVTNDLPVAVTVRITLVNNTGLRTGEIPDRTIPANLSSSALIPSEALRAGRFTVHVRLSTPDGTQLGPIVRFELASNEYGVITIVLTASAGGALLLLSGRRIYQRVRAGRGERRPD